MTDAAAQPWKEMIEPSGRVLFRASFDTLPATLENWHLEGFTGGVTVPEPGEMRLDCTGSEQGGVGVMAFTHRSFPDSIAIEFTLFAEERNGLLLTFLAVQGVEGQDAITDVPTRRGEFEEYTGAHATIRSYHVSLSRYDDNGQHTGVSNWRRNPGLHLMGQGEDPCKEIRKPYHIRIVKRGPLIQLQVDGRVVSGFVDPQNVPGPLPSSGKIGFRAIGSKAVFRISNFSVVALE